MAPRPLGPDSPRRWALESPVNGVSRRIPHGGGAGFTRIIREARSYEDTEVREILTDFHGRALHVMGANDEIIPDGVVRLYRNALSHCGDFESYVLPECPHPIHRWVASRPTERSALQRKVADFVS